MPRSLILTRRRATIGSIVLAPLLAAAWLAFGSGEGEKQVQSDGVPASSSLRADDASVVAADDALVPLAVDATPVDEVDLAMPVERDATASPPARLRSPRDNKRKPTQVKRVAPRVEADLPSMQRRFAEAEKALVAGDLKSAARLFQEVASSPPHRARAYHTLALIFNSMHDLNKALQYIRLAISENEGFAQNHYYHGLILKRMGRDREACKALHEALRWRPAYPDAVEQLRAYGCE